MKFRLFLEQQAVDRWRGRVLLLPQFSVVAKEKAIAIHALKTQLVSFLQKEDLEYVSANYRFEPEQTLVTLELDIVPEKALTADPLLTSIDLIVTQRQVRRGIRYLVSVPLIDDISFTVQDPNAITDKAQTALLNYFKDWSVNELDALDRSLGAELAVVELDDPPSRLQSRSQRSSDQSTNHQPTVLDNCGINLSQKVKTNGLSHFDRRDDLLEQAIAILAQPGPNSLIVVGESGVGKTALVEEITQRMFSGDVPSSLCDRQVWFVAANNLIAGQKYTGEWQEQVKDLIQLAASDRQILFMGNPNEILDAGRWSESDNNMGRFLRPYMESGDITLICECDRDQYEAALKQEPSFIHVMQRLDIPEPSVTEAATIVQQATHHLTRLHNVLIEPDGVQTAMTLTQRFLPYEAFPGKAIRLLRQMVQQQRVGRQTGQERDTLQPLNHHASNHHTSNHRTQTPKISSTALAPTMPERPLPDQTFNPKSSCIVAQKTSQSPISSRHVLEYFARTTGLPLTLLSDAEQLDPQDVQTYFSDRLLGQPDAVAAVTNLITVIKAGLNDPNKPLGSFFFVGPTGVGKTELAKILARYLFGNGDRLLRFDMSEYASGDALARLIGTAWQSQSKDTGELTRRVREQPFSIVLFDEVEKANPVIFDALLGVLGEGRLTNAAGRTTDFRNTIIIMTSNLGASQSQMPSLGFTTESSEKSKDLQAHYVEAAEQFFRPEFFNRIDHLVVFQPLSFEAMGRITRRELDKLLEREGIQKRKLLVEIDDAVIGQLLAQGFHPRYGARPLQREIEKTVIVPLASLLVRKNPTSHQILRFKVRSSRIKIELVPIPTPKPATLPAPNTRQIRALSAILAELAQLQKELLEATDSESLTTLRSTMTRLLAQSYAPTFWDHPTEAQRTLSQIYHLDRVSKRLDDLLERSDRLIQKGESMRLNPPNASFVVKLDQEKTILGGNLLTGP
ncbi:MAG: ATP-dependent Clp protease ATP-binding subunit [Merismopedia sp. SIO2A8]|nr:ATP-dependent Clp protease ATP-binding subunit [Merismopedia sp. SIO2A8]